MSMRETSPRFFDVEGVPVKVEPAPDGGLSVFAFDPLPRFFPLASALRGGEPISRETFLEMVREFTHAPPDPKAELRTHARASVLTRLEDEHTLCDSEAMRVEPNVEPNVEPVPAAMHAVRDD
jgi:hypothetical protein